MLPRFYRFVKYSGRPDLAKVSEVNAVEFPRSGTEADPGASELVPQTKTKGALAKAGTPAAKSVPAKFEGSRAPVLDLQGHFQRLRTVWDPYTPVGLVQHPVKIVAGIDNSSFSESLLKIALPWAEKYRAKFISVHVLEGGRGEGEKAAIRSRLMEWMTDLSDPSGHAFLQEVVL